MNTDLQKRIAEAAKEYANKRFPKHCASENDRRAREDYQLCRDSHIAGAEHGYKEAIEQVKEWMKNYFPEEIDGVGFEFVKLSCVLTDFEYEMYKLLEGKK